MLNVFRFIFSLILCFTVTLPIESYATVLNAGISIDEEVPAELMGTWRVASKLEATDAPKNFKNSGVDIWNLSKTGNVINLCNPVTGAQASVRVEYVKNSTVRFTKEGNYDNQILTDTVEITLSGNKFTGKNYLSLKTFSADNNSLKSEKTAIYILRGDKLSGTSILER